MPTQKQLDEADRVWAGLDHKAIASLTDEQIVAAIADDPDTYCPTDEELENFELVLPVKRPKLKSSKDHVHAA